MSTDYTELSTEAAVIAELAETAAAREPLEIGGDRIVGFILGKDQHLEQIDTERWDANPYRKTGTVQLVDADSFVTYVGRHSTDDGTTLWADIEKARIVAVLDDHDQGSVRAGWGQHRATLQLTHTPDWRHWLELDSELTSQDTFAEHIEDGVDAIRDPDAATMLEVAQTFHAKTGVNYNSSRRLSGEVEFAYEETATARAGQKGKLEVPQILTLGLAPFEGSPEYELKARIRFRLADGHLAIGYRLIRPDKVLRAAFDDVVRAVAGGCDLPVMAGTPRTPRTSG